MDPTPSDTSVEYPIESLPTPAPHQDPEAVVAIQLEALRDNDTPVEDAGLKTTYNFASLESRRRIGAYDRFAQRLRHERYDPLIDHVEAVRGPVERSGTLATQRATITGARGRTVTYRFRLSRAATGPFRTCWLTDDILID